MKQMFGRGYHTKPQTAVGTERGVYAEEYDRARRLNPDLFEEETQKKQPINILDQFTHPSDRAHTEHRPVRCRLQTHRSQPISTPLEQFNTSSALKQFAKADAEKD